MTMQRFGDVSKETQEQIRKFVKECYDAGVGLAETQIQTRDKFNIWISTSVYYKSNPEWAEWKREADKEYFSNLTPEQIEQRNLDKGERRKIKRKLKRLLRPEKFCTICGEVLPYWEVRQSACFDCQQSFEGFLRREQEDRKLQREEYRKNQKEVKHLLRPERFCKRCGEVLPYWERVYCTDECKDTNLAVYEKLMHVYKREPIQCEVCGCPFIEALTVGHKYGDGKKHRGEVKNVYKWILDSLPEDIIKAGVRLECYHCNYVHNRTGAYPSPERQPKWSV